MEKISVRTVKPAAPSLGKADWIRIALEGLINDGIDAVQVTKLAKGLKVSRGSFYWHFSDRKDLLVTVLDEWRAANLPVIECVLKEAATLSEGVLSIFAIWEEHRQFNPKLDQAVRDWARLDDDVLETVREEDGRRIEAIALFFARFGFGESEAMVRARVLYFAQVGYYAMNVDDSLRDRLAMLEDYFLSFTGKVLDENAATDFRQRMGVAT